MKKIPKGFHKHKNGGGLVQNTAKVEETAYIGEHAQVSGVARVSGNAQVSGNAWVFGNAWVYGNARVFGNAWVYGNAQVFGNAQVSGDDWTSSPLYLQGAKHALTNSRYGHIMIGCHEYTFEYWQDHYKAIGRAEGYTKEEIKQYGLFIKLFVKCGK
jgi:hypothetical protein